MSTNKFTSTGVGLASVLLLSSLLNTETVLANDNIDSNTVTSKEGVFNNPNASILVPKDPSKYKEDRDNNPSKNILDVNGNYSSLEEILSSEGFDITKLKTMQAKPLEIEGFTLSYKLCHEVAENSSQGIEHRRGSSGVPVPNSFLEFTFFTNTVNYGTSGNLGGHKLKPVRMPYSLYNNEESTSTPRAFVRHIGRTMNQYAKYQEQFGTIPTNKFDSNGNNIPLAVKYVGLLKRNTGEYTQNTLERYESPYSSNLLNLDTNLMSLFSDSYLNSANSKPFNWGMGVHRCVYDDEKVNELDPQEHNNFLSPYNQNKNKNPNEIIYDSNTKRPLNTLHYGQYYNTHTTLFSGTLYSTMIEEQVKQPGGTAGDVQGNLQWKLKRDDPLKDSNIHVKADNFKKTGTHFATRELYIDVKVNGEPHIERNKRVKEHSVAERDSSLNFVAEYEYTNFWRLVCGMTSCWKVPDWSRGDTFKAEHEFTIATDFKRFIETTNGSTVLPEEDFETTDVKAILPLSDLNNVTKWIVGEDYYMESLRNQNEIINGSNDEKPDAITVTQFFERTTIEDEYMDKQHLVTQTTLPIVVDELDYKVEVPFGSETMEKAFRPQGMFGFYHPIDSDIYLVSPQDTTTDKHDMNPDVDVADKGVLNSHLNDITKLNDERINLDELDQYQRSTDYRGLGTQMIPFAQSSMSGGKATFQTDVQSLSRHTGYIANFSMFNKIREKYRSSKQPIDLSKEIATIKEHHISMYEQDLDYKFLDEVMYTDNDFDERKLQRYYLPLEVDSPIVPQEEHRHYTHIYDIGLNDGGVGFNRIYEYDMYLLGVDSGNNVGFLINETGEHKNLISTSSNDESNPENKYKHVKEYVIEATEISKYAEKEGLRDNLPKIFRMRAIDRDYMGERKESEEYKINTNNDEFLEEFNETLKKREERYKDGRENLDKNYKKKD